MENLKICSKCIQPNTRPGIFFNDEIAAAAERRAHRPDLAASAVRVPARSPQRGGAPPRLRGDDGDALRRGAGGSPGAALLLPLGALAAPRAAAALRGE